ncbi:MAG: hypothetical protein CL916_02360, partial [Deltaproteobacteria bacterium]|nr:hypothetical protein [Deltaproteobacteria bacterium]
MFPFFLLFSYGCNNSDKDTEDQNIGDTDSLPELDIDGDGLSVEDGDCDDEDANIPGEELCDGIDNNCDGNIDESDAFDASIWYGDQDGDGFGSAIETLIACEAPEGFVDNNEDCNDEDGDIYPQAVEVWYDGIDQNCDESNDYDQDGDGQDTSDYGGNDCDDEEDSIYFGAPETWYDGIDSDCDGESDYDQDGDGDDSIEYGGDDCDDNDSSINTSATEIWYD